MNKLENDYDSLFENIEKLNQKNDNERAHILQDRIYRKFIKDICNNKFKTLRDIKLIANDMNKYVVKKDKKRWYA